MVENFNKLYNEAIDNFAQMIERRAIAINWCMNSATRYQKSIQLFLYIRAISNYDPNSSNNYLTDNQVYFILSQIRKIIGTNESTFQTETGRSC